MKAYWIALLATVVCCHCLLLVTPEENGFRKNVRWLCGLVLLCTLFLPLRGLMETLPDIFSEQMGEDTEELYLEEDIRMESAYAALSTAWIAHLSSEYGLPLADIRMTWITSDDTQALTEVQVFLPSCSPGVQRDVEKEMREKIPAEIYVFRES